MADSKFTMSDVAAAVDSWGAFQASFVVRGKTLSLCLVCVSTVKTEDIENHYAKLHGGGNPQGMLGTCYTCCKPLPGGNEASTKAHFNGKVHNATANKWENQGVCTLCYGSFKLDTVHAGGAHEAYEIRGFDADNELFEHAREQTRGKRDTKAYHEQNVHSTQMAGSIVEVSCAVRTAALMLGATEKKTSAPVCVTHICLMTQWDSFSPVDTFVIKAAEGALCRACKTLGKIVDDRVVLLKPKKLDSLSKRLPAKGIAYGSVNATAQVAPDAPTGANWQADETDSSRPTTSRGKSSQEKTGGNTARPKPRAPASLVLKTTRVVNGVEKVYPAPRIAKPAKNTDEVDNANDASVSDEDEGQAYAAAESDSRDSSSESDSSSDDEGGAF